MVHFQSTSLLPPPPLPPSNPHPPFPFQPPPMKLILLASLLAVASSFTVHPSVRVATSLSAAPKSTRIVSGSDKGGAVVVLVCV